MKFVIAAVLVLFLTSQPCHADDDAAEVDWLVATPSEKAQVLENVCWSDGLCGIELRNGLVSRRFVTSPAFGTVDLLLNTTRDRGGLYSTLRSIMPEGNVTLNGTTFAIGGLQQRSRFLGYLDRSLLELDVMRGAFNMSSYSVSQPTAPFPWLPGSRHSPIQAQWPPPGVRLQVNFQPPHRGPIEPQWLANFTGIAGQQQQLLLLDKPATGRYWWLKVPHTFGEKDLRLYEVVFCYANGGCRMNNGNATVNIVQSSSGFNSIPDGFGGAPWQAADGNYSTGWDAVFDGSQGDYYLVFDLTSEQTITGLNVTTFGDIAHDAIAYQIFVGREAAVDPDVRLSLIYDLYDGVPLITTQMVVTLQAGSKSTALLSAAGVSQLSVNSPFGVYVAQGPYVPGNDVDGHENIESPSPWLQAKTDQAHSAVCMWSSNQFQSYNPNCPCEDEGASEPRVMCGAVVGQYLSASSSYSSFRALHIFTDSYDVERQSLARHRVTQLLAPHTMENPIFFHATNISSSGFVATVDALAAVGFEMLVYSFATGFDMENPSPEYLDSIAQQVSYARGQGIEVGGYDLIDLDRYDLPSYWEEINSGGSSDGNGCFASGWYDKLTNLIYNFLNTTGLSMVETDGPYGGGTCYSTNHSHHRDNIDSIYAQTQLQNAMYTELRRRGVYINQPDNYFFYGGNRAAMGYNEYQYSLPRQRDLEISRAGMYDDFYMRLPSQGWMFVPIDQYHSGGNAATFRNHNQDYDWALAQYLGAGVAAFYRGAVPFWDETSRASCLKWVGFYKKHRGTIIQPVVHLRRADMQGWDGFLHVNPRRWTTPGQSADPLAQREVGLAMIFNPTQSVLSTTIALPLYYTGLTTEADIEVDENGKPARYSLDRSFFAYVKLSMLPRSVHTIVIRTPDTDR